jgi:(S)-sulfolactate dehydrogenase
MALVVVSEWIDGAALERLKSQHEVVADAALHADRPRLFEALAQAEALVVRNQTRVDAALLDAAPRLRVIGRVGVGLDTIDVAACSARDVVVSWAPGTNATSVAEYVIGAVIALARRFGPATSHVSDGGWQRQAFMGREIAGATLGIVGLGDIGARVARRAHALGMRLLGNDPVVHESSAAVQEFGVELVGLEQLLSRSAAVTLHVPLVSTTRDLIDATAIEHMPRGSWLINTARGELVDEQALAEALRSGHLGGAALDVRRSEPPSAPDPLAGCPNLILTPHVAGVTVEANVRASEHAVDEVLRVLRGERARTPAPA